MYYSSKYWHRKTGDRNNISSGGIVHVHVVW